MSTSERCPAGAPSELIAASKTSVPQSSPSPLNPEDRHAAFCAGYETGKAERVELAIEEQVCARLHQLSLEALGMARRHAAATGPAWALLIAWAGSTDD